jgi:hypothetical protein
MLRAIDCLQSVFLKTPGTNALPLFQARWLFWMLMWQPCVLSPLCDPERGQSISEQSSSLCCTKHTVFGVGGRLEPESFPPIPGLLRCTLLHLQPPPPPPPPKKNQWALLLPSKQFIRNHCKISGELCWPCSRLWTTYPKAFLNILILADYVLMKSSL